MNKKLLEKIDEVVPEEALQALLNEWNPIIRVDRTVRPTYPDLVKEVKYPELELTGPAEFDIRKIEQWRHPKQIEGYATGDEIHEELLAKKLLDGCLCFADLLAIQERGISFFRRHFAGIGVIPAWKSVVMDRDGDLDVPYLYEYDDEVKLYWFWLDDSFDSGHPAVRVPQVSAECSDS